MEKKYIYLSGLNGLRTVAALSVLLSHIALSIKQFNVSTYLFGLDEDGNPNSWYLGSMGVTIFFCFEWVFNHLFVNARTRKRSY